MGPRRTMNSQSTEPTQPATSIAEVRGKGARSANSSPLASANGRRKLAVAVSVSAAVASSSTATEPTVVSFDKTAAEKDKDKEKRGIPSSVLALTAVASLAPPQQQQLQQQLQLQKGPLVLSLQSNVKAPHLSNIVADAVNLQMNKTPAMAKAAPRIHFNPTSSLSIQPPLHDDSDVSSVNDNDSDYLTYQQQQQPKHQDQQQLPSATYRINTFNTDPSNHQRPQQQQQQPSIRLLSSASSTAGQRRIQMGDDRYGSTSDDDEIVDDVEFQDDDDDEDGADDDELEYDDEGRSNNNDSVDGAAIDQQFGQHQGHQGQASLAPNTASTVGSALQQQQLQEQLERNRLEEREIVHGKMPAHLRLALMKKRKTLSKRKKGTSSTVAESLGAAAPTEGSLALPPPPTQLGFINAIEKLESGNKSIFKNEKDLTIVNCLQDAMSELGHLNHVLHGTSDQYYDLRLKEIDLQTRMVDSVITDQTDPTVNAVESMYKGNMESSKVGYKASLEYIESVYQGSLKAAEDSYHVSVNHEKKERRIVRDEINANLKRKLAELEGEKYESQTVVPTDSGEIIAFPYGQMIVDLFMLPDLFNGITHDMPSKRSIQNKMSIARLCDPMDEDSINSDLSYIKTMTSF
ncbi:UNVERIFIED_CONTAM: hypothetical protein HDU68_005584 [Siphonaria sp. JEL0065]|nr:hypothetical protein HDU68_005584 [Siphonaria sp. JEL0065]